MQTTENSLYTEQKLARVAKRENNNKRKYLVVDPLQGKHVPTSGKASLAMFDALAEKVRLAYLRDCCDPILLVGFAETATAIGARLAVTLESPYMQTTREVLKNADYLFFTESHSHATEQKLCKNDVEKIIGSVSRVVFVEDEITTGNTIMKIIDIMREKYGENVKFAAASLLNGMDGYALKRYSDKSIDVHYLVKTHHEGYTAIAEGYSDNGSYIAKNTDSACLDGVRIFNINEGYTNTRRLCDGSEYGDRCAALFEKISQTLPSGIKTVDVIGTEEFMYPAIYTAARLEENGLTVTTHSTTRSPIAVSLDEGYPLRARFELASLYDAERKTFIYDLKKSDLTIIITDSPKITKEGAASLANALRSVGNDNILIYRWCDDE